MLRGMSSRHRVVSSRPWPRQFSYREISPKKDGALPGKNHRDTGNVKGTLLHTQI